MTFGDNFRLVQRTEASDEILTLASPYEQQFGIAFSRFFLASGDALARLHGKRDPPLLEGRLVIASETNPNILQDLQRLRQIANQTQQSREDRLHYLSSLMAIYQHLPTAPIRATKDKIVVAPQREGRWLAERLGWLDSERSFTPNAKRIHWDSGLIVGLDDLNLSGHCLSAAIIDGAIASGSTVMGLLAALSVTIDRFEVYSVHAALEGIFAILRFAQSIDRQIQITVGCVTEGLNSAYYAVDRSEASVLQVGDLGDTIATVITS